MPRAAKKPTAGARTAPILSTTYRRDTMQLLLTAASKDAARVNIAGVWVYPGGCAASTDGHTMIMVRGAGADDSQRPEWTDAAFWSKPLAFIDREDWRRLIATTPKGHYVAIEGTTPEDDEHATDVRVEITAARGMDGTTAMPIRNRMTGAIKRTAPPFHNVYPSKDQREPVELLGINPLKLATIAKALNAAIASNTVAMVQHGELGPVLLAARDADRDIETIGVVMPIRLGGKDTPHCTMAL